MYNSMQYVIFYNFVTLDFGSTQRRHRKNITVIKRENSAP